MENSQTQNGIDQTQSESAQTVASAPSTERPAGEPFRFSGDQYPSWMQGRTAEEVARMAAEFYNENLQLRTQMFPQRTEAPVNTSAPQPPNPDLMYSNPAEYQRRLIEYNNSITQAALAAVTQQFSAPLASTARDLSRMGPMRKVWDKYEPEIEREVSSIPIHLRTREVYDKAAEIVRARHVDDEVQERLEQLMAQGGGSGTERASSAGGPNMPPMDKLDEVYDSDHPFFQNARKEGVTKQDIREHCKKVGISVDEYVANATSGVVVLGRHGFERRYA